MSGPAANRAGPAALAGMSSAIRSVRYDPDRRELIVTFHGGAAYRYFDVSAETAAALAAAPSAGVFVNARIKPHHPVVSLGPPRRIFQRT